MVTVDSTTLVTPGQPGPGGTPEGAAGISNADHDFLGPLLPRQALANSRNIPAANLLRRIGLADGFNFLHELHLHDLPGPAEHYGLAMAIGALPSSLARRRRPAQGAGRPEAAPAGPSASPILQKAGCPGAFRVGGGRGGL